MHPPTLLVLVTSCLIVLVTAETQSAHTASSKSGASNALTFSRQQQQQQQQQKYQHLQQPSSPRYSHLAPNQQAISADSATNNAIPDYVTSSQTLGYSSPNILSSDVSSHMNSNSHIDEVKNSKAEDTSKANSLDNSFKSILFTPVKSDSEFSYKNLISNSIYNSEDNSLSSQGDVLSRGIQRSDHRVDKREAATFYPASDGRIESEYPDEDYPIHVDRRFQVFLPSTASASSPYLSAQEFKETFRRSDPYFMGKRATDLFSGGAVTSSGDRRHFYMTEAPYFTGERESTEDLESYLAKLASQDDDNALLEDKRAAPKFVGKRGAPMFVGKRLPLFEIEDDTVFPSEDKRAAPKFVGRRGAPYFVGKRELPGFAGKRWSELSPEDELNWLFENQNAASKFVGRRGAPYFVGKRPSPMFIGKRAGLFELDDGESPLLNDRSEMANFFSRRGAPYFVGKRVPKFVGKRWANPDLQKVALGNLQDKRLAPKFVGRRGAPYFVGKREPPNFMANEFSSEGDDKQLLEDKRGAPKFVGRRGAPRFIGKRVLPFFNGEHVVDFEWADSSIDQSEGKRAAPKFVGRRGAPKFVGRRGAPIFVGRRGAPIFVGRRGAPKFVGRRVSPKFIGRRVAPKFVGRRAAPKFVGKRGAPKFVGRRGAPKFVGKRGAPKFVGRRGAPKFVGKRDFYLLDGNTNKVLFGKEAGDFGQETNEYIRTLLEEKGLNGDTSFLTGINTDSRPSQPESEKHIHLQTIENAGNQDRQVQEHSAVERQGNEQFQNAPAEEPEELR